MAKSKTTEAGAGAGAGAGASCSSSKSREKPLTIPNSVNIFSELEANAIALLLQLSGSSCCNGGSTATEEESESKSRAARPPHHDDQVSSSFSKYETLASKEDGEEVEDEDELSFGPKKKRFRPISDLYKLTEPLSLLKRQRKKIVSN